MNLGHLILDSLIVGLPYALDFLGVWLIYRLLNDFDMTVDGSFTMGAAVTATLITFYRFNPVLATIAAAGSGVVAGMLTSFVHLKMRVPLLLAGIISMIGLYSINLRVMGNAPNIALIQVPTIFSPLIRGDPLMSDVASLGLLVVLIMGIAVLLGAFLKTELGLSLRATGANPQMARSLGVNTSFCVLVFVLLANFLAAFSGSVTAQQEQFADINMGIGVILVGIAALLLGELILRSTGAVWAGIGAVMIGTVVYYVIVSIVIRLGLSPTDLRALTSVVLIVAIGASMGISWGDRRLRVNRRDRLGRGQALPANAAVTSGEHRIVGEPALSNRFVEVDHNLPQTEGTRAHQGPTSDIRAAPTAARLDSTKGDGQESWLSLRDITVIYNRAMPSEVIALRSLSLEIPKGQFVTIIGSNGAGKTTLVSAVAGSVVPIAGQIRLRGRNVSDTVEYERSRYVARVFQDPQVGTCANFSIEENLAMAERRGQPRGLSLAVTQKSRSRYWEFLRQFGLGFESRLTEKVGALSGGQRQALALLMAVMRAPDILLLDEHTAALDPKNRTILQELTERVVREQGCTTIMVTHNMDTAIRYGERMVMLHRGSILFDVQGHTKQSLTVEKLISSFHAADDAVLTDELLFT